MKRGTHGFTLIEVLAVMLVVSLAAITIVKLQGNMFTGQSSIKDLQVRSALLQECAEEVLAKRQLSDDGYASNVISTAFTAGACGSVAAFSDGTTNYTIPDAVITDPYTGAACPANGICKTVTLRSGALQSVTVLLVDY